MEVSAAGEAMQHLAHSNRFLRKEGSHGNLGGNLVPASIDSPALGSPSLQAKIHRKIQEAALGNAPLTEQATQEAAQQIAQANMPALGSLGLSSGKETSKARRHPQQRLLGLRAQKKWVLSLMRREPVLLQESL